MIAIRTPGDGSGDSGRASTMSRSAVPLCWFSSVIAALRRSGVAEMTFTEILRRASPPLCLSTIAFHTFSAASLLAGEASRWARMNSQSANDSVAGSCVATACTAASAVVSALEIEAAKLSGGRRWPSAMRVSSPCQPSSLP